MKSTFRRACRGRSAVRIAGARAADPPLRTGVDGTFAPHAFPKLGGGTQGFQIDVFTEVAKRMKREITIDSVSFSTLIPGMQSGRYDFIAAPTTVTKERAEQMLFTVGLSVDRLPVRHQEGHAADQGLGGPQGQGGVGQQGHALRDAEQAEGPGDRLRGPGLRHPARCHAGGALGPRLRDARRQHRDRLHRLEEPAVRRRPRAQGHARALGGADPQGQRRSCATSCRMRWTA